MARLRSRPLLLEVLEDRLLLSGPGASSSPEPTLTTRTSEVGPAAPPAETTSAAPPTHAKDSQGYAAPAAPAVAAPASSHSDVPPATVASGARGREHDRDDDSPRSRRGDGDDDYRDAGELAALVNQAAAACHCVTGPPSPYATCPHLPALPAPGAGTPLLAGTVAPLSLEGPLPVNLSPGPAPAGRSASPEAEEASALPALSTTEASELVEAPSAISSLQRAAAEACRLALEPAAPLAALAPIDLRRLEESADAFFEHLARLGDTWEGGRFCLDLAPWLLIGAAAAWELAFLPRKVRRQGPGMPPCDRIALSLEEG
jgi:hypothetical protein